MFQGVVNTMPERSCNAIRKFILLVCVVYVDACSTRSSKFATACGYMTAVAIMLWQQCVLVHDELLCLGSPRIVFWLVDLTWTLASSLYCTFVVFDYIAHIQEVQMAFVVSTIYAVHIWTGCSTHNIGDLMIRFVLYCGVCALLMFGGQVIQQSNDKYTQMRNATELVSVLVFMNAF